MNAKSLTFPTVSRVKCKMHSRMNDFGSALCTLLDLPPVCSLGTCFGFFGDLISMTNGRDGNASSLSNKIGDIKGSLRWGHRDSGPYQGEQLVEVIISVHKTVLHII